MTHVVRDAKRAAGSAAGGAPAAPRAAPRAAPAIEGLDVDALRQAIREEYTAVASDPGRGFHFHTGRPLARMLGYDDAWLAPLPEATVAAFAGTGNPFAAGLPTSGQRVVDVGCGAGIDTLIAARLVGPDGAVVGVDMTPAMLARAHRSAEEAGLDNVVFHQGLAESLPVPDGWADLVISNGVLNLMPDKAAALAEIARVLRPDGRLQFGDILVQRAVSDRAKRDIDLWKG